MTTHINNLKLWKPKDETMWIDSPQSYLIDIINLKNEQERGRELLLLEKHFNTRHISYQNRDLYYLHTAQQTSKIKTINDNNKIIHHILNITNT